MDEYFKHWDNKSAADETEEDRKVRKQKRSCVFFCGWCGGIKWLTRCPVRLHWDFLLI